MHSKTILSALCLSLINTATHAVSITGQGAWETTLQGRDLDGNLSTFEAYYDTAQNISWLADANFANTTMDWSTANAWVTSLNSYNSGITGWRQPTVTDTNASSCQFAFSGTDCGFNVDLATGEMAHMFYSTLGNTPLYDAAGNAPQANWGLSNTGPFSNLQAYNYWTSTTDVDHVNDAWTFHFQGGDQMPFTKTNTFYTWAVYAGDVGEATPSVVPVTASGAEALRIFGHETVLQ